MSAGASLTRADLPPREASLRPVEPNPAFGQVAPRVPPSPPKRLAPRWLLWTSLLLGALLALLIWAERSAHRPRHPLADSR
jgi:hypothetical protein